jgi:hypothetical protein
MNVLIDLLKLSINYIRNYSKVILGHPGKYPDQSLCCLSCERKINRPIEMAGRKEENLGSNGLGDDFFFCPIGDGVPCFDI